MACEKILIIDDEVEICELISIYLKKNGFIPITANNGSDALNLTSLHNPDLIILDILLPDTDGLELCQELRKTTKCPIIFLSAKSSDMDKILGLTVGGDDYITKPFSPSVLVARVKAHLRRKRLSTPQVDTENTIISFPGIKIDLSSHSTYIDNKSVALSQKEFDILLLMAQNPNKVFSHGQLYDYVWGADNIGDTRTVMVHISNLRKKIEKDHANPKIIVNIKGVGYKFNTTNL